MTEQQVMSNKRKKQFLALQEMAELVKYQQRKLMVERLVDITEGHILNAKIKFKPKIYDAFYAESSGTLNAKGEVRKGKRQAGWVIEMPMGGSLFVPEEAFGHYFKIVEEE